MTNEIIHYTTEEIKHLSNKDIVEIVKSSGKSSRGIQNYLRSINLLDEIVSRTHFLYEHSSIPSRLYCLEHSITSQPLCIICNENPVHWDCTSGTFNKYCSSKCAHRDPETYRKTQETCEKRYGCMNPGQSEEAKKKREDTNMTRYGVKNVYQSKEIKDRIRQTNELKYGVEYTMQSEEIKERLRQSMLKNHGVEYATQLDFVKEKIKETCKEHFGVEHPAQSPIV